ADFAFSPTDPSVSQLIHFESQASDPDGYIAKMEWDFGDGDTSKSKNPSHRFESSGVYTVTLRVTDQSGATSSDSKKVNVENLAPRAKFSFNPEDPKTGSEIILDASSSSDPDGKIKNYSWDLNGDGNIDEKKDTPRLTFKFPKSGPHSVTLTVTDNNGVASSTTKEIEVLPGKPEEIDEKHALVVGITEYQHEALNNLNFPAKDAKAFYDLLVSDEMGGFSEENITLLTNKKATRRNLDNALTNLVTEASKDDLVVIYYSGHGAQGPDYDGDEGDGRDEYYITYDSDPSTGKALYKTAYRDDVFANKVKSISTDQIAIFLDSCYSGGATKTVKGYTLPGQKAVPRNNVFSDFENLKGKVLFAASQENESSYEPSTPELKEKLGHGVFTYYLLKGLKGEADKDDDGNITIEELKGYVTPEVQEFTQEHLAASQKPLVKGNISAPLIARREKLEGEVKYVKGETNEKANQGDYVVINLGTEDGVKREDTFRVFYASKGVGVIEQLQGKLQITDVVGPHLAVAKVEESGFTVKAGYKVKKVE
ncbi:caspase family protein, partial [Candidatus Bipolaricaulota bacterium]|nr:caspase family protein [Candidatus Bipolaricaulota bacterium]